MLLAGTVGAGQLDFGSAVTLLPSIGVPFQGKCAFHGDIGWDHMADG